tara:strand:- start:18568 stop:18864 length:297 start_codon:yes stop_codon:yes gene_type:complete
MQLPVNNTAQRVCNLILSKGCRDRAAALQRKFNARPIASHNHRDNKILLNVQSASSSSGNRSVNIGLLFLGSVTKKISLELHASHHAMFSKRFISDTG